MCGVHTNLLILPIINCNRLLKYNIETLIKVFKWNTVKLYVHLMQDFEMPLKNEAVLLSGRIYLQNMFSLSHLLLSLHQWERHHRGPGPHVLCGTQRLWGNHSAWAETQWQKHPCDRGEQKGICQVHQLLLPRFFFYILRWGGTVTCWSNCQCRAVGFCCSTVQCSGVILSVGPCFGAG